jgi:hypothetical protein
MPIPPFVFGRSPKWLLHALHGKGPEFWITERVQVAGLKDKPELNMKIGRVLSYNAETMRYNVHVENSAQWLALKEPNLLWCGEDAQPNVEDGGHFFDSLPVGLQTLCEAGARFIEWGYSRHFTFLVCAVAWFWFTSQQV